MPEGTEHPPGGPPRRKDGKTSSDDFATLRHLILGPERQEIAQVKQQLERLGRVAASDVAPVLPAAIMQSKRESQQIAEAMLPIVEDDLSLSIKRHPEKLADLLFPVMGPAIRKAIREAMNSMIQSINQTVDHAVSPKGIQWRLEAMRTGKSFSEVVFVHTMRYRVEQVFLIHRETGLLLQHAAAPNVKVQDPDMVSGMLTAIQDFVRDSFKNGSDPGDDGLGSLEIGGVTVWIVPGPSASVAGVIRGHAPRDLKSVFHVALEDIHREQLDDLTGFKGDTSRFEIAKPHLEGCLQFQSNTTEAAAAAAAKRRIQPATIIGGLLAALLIGGAAWYLYGAWRWHQYLETLEQQPGIVITKSHRGWWTNLVTGLRDPLAADPASFLAAAGFAPGDVKGTWTPYQALEPAFVLTRAKNLLAPPETVAMTLQPGGVLEASGLASGNWIADARKLALAVPGISRFEGDRLIDERWAELQRLRDKVQVYNVLFGEGHSQPLATQPAPLAEISADITRVVQLSRATQRSVAITLFGHTDGSGAEGVNQTLSNRRAEAVRGMLIAAGLPKDVAVAIRGVSNTDPLRQERTDDDRAWNRRVTIRIDLGNVDSRTDARIAS